MKQIHAQVLEKLYACLSRGEFQAAADLCSEKMTFQVPGRSKLAGKYDRLGFTRDFSGKLRELSGDTFKMEIHDILASDLHATVMGSCKLMHDGKPVELRTVHVWRFEDGKPLAGYEYPRDLYQFDAIWG